MIMMAYLGTNLTDTKCSNRNGYLQFVHGYTGDNEVQMDRIGFLIRLGTDWYNWLLGLSRGSFWR